MKCIRTCGLVAMTSASHAEGRQFDPGQVYFCIRALHRNVAQGWCFACRPCLPPPFYRRLRSSRAPSSQALLNGAHAFRDATTGPHGRPQTETHRPSCRGASAHTLKHEVGCCNAGVAGAHLVDWLWGDSANVRAAFPWESHFRQARPSSVLVDPCTAAFLPGGRAV